MTLATVYSRALLGMDAPLVCVEVDIAPGLPSLSMVGMAETAVKESKDRVRSALLHGNFHFPEGRVTINLAPADLPKSGSRYDLPIALGILAASNQLPTSLAQYECIGELGLSGTLRTIPGILPSALATQKAGRSLCLPADGLDEATLLADLPIYGAPTLQALVSHLTGVAPLPPHTRNPITRAAPSILIEDIQGQWAAKRALCVAASGGHHLLLIGPPGTGKTMLAQSLPGILPLLTDSEALEVAALHSLHAPFDPDHWQQRPFRTPHHSISAVALIGGGRDPKPGEISLAHRGVLFLDELPEFPKQALEILRQPLSSGQACIARARRHVTFPACCQLIAAMNPCPCGYYKDPDRPCLCTPLQVQRYRQKISGPLLDRIDMQIWMDRQKPTRLTTVPHDTTEGLQAQVAAAHAVQYARQGMLNAHLSPKGLLRSGHFEPETLELLEQFSARDALSLRSQHRLLKVARTIADLQHAHTVASGHLFEALSFRRDTPARVPA